MSDQPIGDPGDPQGQHPQGPQNPPPYPPYPGYPPQQPGYPYPPQPYAYGPPEDPGARTAMITGIVSLVTGFLCGIGFFGSPVALVIGLRSMRRIDASNGALRGRGDAQAGFILGILGTVMLVLAVLAAFLLLVLLVVGLGSDDSISFDSGIAT